MNHSLSNRQNESSKKKIFATSKNFKEIQDIELTGNGYKAELSKN